VGAVTQDGRPCPVVPPVIVSYLYSSPAGWNAVVSFFFRFIEI